MKTNMMNIQTLHFSKPKLKEAQKVEIITNTHTREESERTTEGIVQSGRSLSFAVLSAPTIVRINMNGKIFFYFLQS